MRTPLASLLSIIAVGVLLIAYDLLGPRAGAATDTLQSARGVPVNDRIAPAGVASLVGFAGAQQAAASGLQLRCEPGQRALIKNVGGATEAACADDATSDSRYTMTRAALAYPVSDVQEYRAAVRTKALVSQRSARTVARRPQRDWGKTAMVIGGSSAAGAGLGAIFGGRNGALVGAAIGGGAGTLFEVKKPSR